MTEISRTDREPLCDIAAQFTAYHDPEHPKRAVWVSDGTPYCANAPSLYLPRIGTLYASAHDRGRLEDDPTEETLAELLDYVEPKSLIRAKPALWWPVVQALDTQRCVVWEQISSWERCHEAMTRARRYGEMVVRTSYEALARRRRLILREEDGAPRASLGT